MRKEKKVSIIIRTKNEEQWIEMCLRKIYEQTYKNFEIIIVDNLSKDKTIDPVGACVGVKGSRIHGIVRELRNENIDVINFTENMNLLISRAVSPAKVTSIEIDKEKMTANVFMSPDQVSLAIGKRGYNIKLAGELTGYEIDVYRDTEGFEDDVALSEFSDEIDGWVIETLQAIGCDSARSVSSEQRLHGTGTYDFSPQDSIFE